jgi:hypothetical protein
LRTPEFCPKMDYFPLPSAVFILKVATERQEDLGAQGKLGSNIQSTCSLESLLHLMPVVS